MGRPNQVVTSSPRRARSRRLLALAACGTLALGGFSLPAASFVPPLSVGQATAQSGGEGQQAP